MKDDWTEDPLFAELIKSLSGESVAERIRASAITFRKVGGSWVKVPLNGR